MTTERGVSGKSPGGRIHAGRAAAILHTLGVTVGIQAIGLVTGILIARMLGVTGRGDLAAILLWVSLISYLGDLGFPLACTYEAARDRSQIPALIGNVYLMIVIQAIVLSLIGVPVLALALHHLGRDVVITAIVYLIVYMPAHLGRYLNAICQGDLDFRRFNLIRISVMVFTVIPLAVIYILGQHSLHAVVACSVFGPLATMVAAYLLVHRRYVRELGRPQVSLPLLRRMLRYGLSAHIGNLTPVDSMQLDLLLVVALLGAHDAGLYTVAISAALVVRAQGTAFGMVMISEVAAADGREQQRRRICGYTKLGVVGIVGAALVLIIFARPLIGLVYGPAFAGASPVVRILALGMAAAAMREMLGDALRGAGSQVGATIAEMASWPVGALALVVLIPLIGLQGAAWGVSLSYVAALAVCLRFTRRLGIGMRELFVPSRRDVALTWSISHDLLSSFRRQPERL